MTIGLNRHTTEEVPLKKTGIFAALLLSAILTAGVRAQDTAQKQTPVKPADSPSQTVLEAWNDIGRKLIAMAEDFPEDKYDFKATPAQRSFAENLLHASGVNYFFTNVVRGEKPPTEENPKRELYKTKADVVVFVKKSFADGADAIKAKGDKGMSQLVVDPYAHQQVRISDFAYGFIEHNGEHYGQLVVYYRLSGLVPPESRPKK
jgi:uncharacterized damage-inducible protein DinB